MGKSAPLRARRADHVWVVDFTVVKRFFRSVIVGVVLDAWSRKVLALRVWPAEPAAADACLLVHEAIRFHGPPTWLVCDRGVQFTSARFRAFLARRKIRRRHAAVGDANLSRIDRLWRSMKDEFAGDLLLFRPVHTIQRQLRAYARWHAIARPHQGLGLRIPGAVHEGARPRRLRRVDRAVLEIKYLDGDHCLPLFRLRSAA